MVDNPQRADTALWNHIVDMMDHRRAECLMLMSDDSDFVDVVMEAKLRCLKTVVVGDFGDGALKRVAASGFSWNEILIGKAKKEAVLVVGKWKDRDVLKRLEWTYKPDEDQSVHSWDDEIDGESKEEEIEGMWSNDLEFLCSAWPDRLEVQKVYVLHHDRMPAKPYMGPDFGSLKRTIQKRFIDQGLRMMTFLFLASIYDEQG